MILIKPNKHSIIQIKIDGKRFGMSVSMELHRAVDLCPRPPGLRNAPCLKTVVNLVRGAGELTHQRLA